MISTNTSLRISPLGLVWKGLEILILEGLKKARDAAICVRPLGMRVTVGQSVEGKNIG